MTPRAHPGQAETEPESDAPRLHVLLAEDDARMRHLLAQALRRDGFEVSEAKSGVELLLSIGEHLLDPENRRSVDLIITDLRMPVLGGLDVLADLRWHSWAVPVIVITAFGDEETHAEAKRLGAAAIFDKPFDLDDIRMAALHYAGTGRGR